MFHQWGQRWIFFLPVSIRWCELWMSPPCSILDKQCCPKWCGCCPVTVLLHAVPTALRGLRGHSAAWLQGEITVRDRLDVVTISSEFLCNLGAWCHCQSIHSVPWSEDTSVCPLSFLFLKVKCNELEFIAVAFCSGIYHRPGDKNSKRPALENDLH